MNTKTSWILVGAAAVLATFGVAAGLGVFSGADRHHHTPAGSQAKAVALPVPVAAASEPIAASLPAEAPIDLAALQPHVAQEGEAERSAEGTPMALGDAEEEATPTTIPETDVMPQGPVALRVGELTAAAAEFAGREVILTGRILTLCVRGCQLSLDDGTGVMPVELVDDALGNTVPLRSMGRQIEVTGVFRLSPRPHVSVERPDGWRFP